jgi:hypothetical protein
MKPVSAYVFASVLGDMEGFLESAIGVGLRKESTPATIR